MKYIGIKEASPSSKGNKNEVWVKGEDGYYRCSNNPKKVNMKFSQWQIGSDLRNGYIREI